MASLSDMVSYHHHHHHSNKITKAPRGGKMVKPILKKLASSSSPKNSLDLDRGWEEQPIDLGYGSSAHESGRPSMSPSMRDVSFQFAPWEPSGYGHGGGAGSGAGSGTATPVGGVGVGVTGGLESTSLGAGVGGVGGVGGAVGPAGATSARSLSSRSRFQHHARSTSATSIATTGSNHRLGGSFVHPFQQQPRTTTPPLTYANSFTSFERDNNPARDYSPTIITENDDDDFDRAHAAGSTSQSQSQSLTSHSHLHRHAPSNSHSTTSLRRPSLASQRTSSLSDIRHHSNNSANNHNHNQPPPLRVNTNPIFPRSVPSASSRLAHGALNTSCSNSDLQLNAGSPADSPRPSIHLASSSTNSATPMSPLRTSLEGAFRLRSRSDVDTGTNRVDIREARRKFEESERIKQEKYEAEQRRKQERKQEKERAAASRKNTGGSEMSSIGRPSFSRKRTPPFDRVQSAGSAGQQSGSFNEKYPPGGAAAFLSSHYESTEGGVAPDFGPDVADVRFETPKRSHTAKRKTQSYWTSFMLWLRTRLLKLGRR